MSCLFILASRGPHASRLKAAAASRGSLPVAPGPAVDLRAHRTVEFNPLTSCSSPRARRETVGRLKTTLTNPTRPPVLPSSSRAHRARQLAPRPVLLRLASPRPVRNAAGRLKTAATDLARFPVPPTVLESAARPPKSPRGPSCSKSRLRASRGTVRQKKEKISPVRLLPRRLFHLGAHGSTSYIAARSL